jgi:hypothetical protein
MSLMRRVTFTVVISMAIVIFLALQRFNVAQPLLVIRHSSSVIQIIRAIWGQNLVFRESFSKTLDTLLRTLLRGALASEIRAEEISKF